MIQLAVLVIMILVFLYNIVLLIFLLLSLLPQNIWWIDLLKNFTPFLFLPSALFLPFVFILGGLHFKLSALCVFLAALVWFGPYFLPKLTIAKPSDQFTIATLNADVENTQVESIEAWLRSSTPNVVLLQETPDSWRDKNISAKLSDLYPYSLIQNNDENEDAKVFLSVFPIVSSSEFLLTDMDRFIQQRVVIDTSLGTLAVYNIHLMPNYGDVPRFVMEPYNPMINIALSYDETIRAAQIYDLLLRLSREHLPYVVAGDFNTSNFSNLYSIMATHLVDSFREAGIGFGMTWPVAAYAKLPKFLPPLLRIDYIWHSSALRATTAWVGDTVGSDHFPVTAALTLPSIKRG